MSLDEFLDVGSRRRVFYRGFELIGRGLFWDAHETWECLWRAAPGPTARTALQSLILWAAAAHKGMQGNLRGRSRLAARAMGKLGAPERSSLVSVGVVVGPIVEQLCEWATAG